jgi:hypothetical protein
MLMSTPPPPWLQKKENGENSENVSSALPNSLKSNHLDRRIRNRFCSDALGFSLSTPSVSRPFPVAGIGR